jgi:hypothetical protein
MTIGPSQRTTLQVLTNAGWRAVTGYVLPAHASTYARTSEPNALAGTPTIKWGDKLPLPSPLTVRALIHGDTLQEAASLAYALLDDFQSASWLYAYDGAHHVDGVLAYHVTSERGARVTLEVSFAPKGATT